MKHKELLQKIEDEISNCQGLMAGAILGEGLKAVVELHNEDFGLPGEDVVCDYCKVIYPCPTIKAIYEGFNK